MASKEAKVSRFYWMHVAIGLLLMIGFPQLKPIEPITEVGMWVGGIFLGMVYLWSTLDSIWPSLLGLLLLAAFSGYTGPEVTGYAAVKQVLMESIGNDTVITILLGMVLFGAFEALGCTKYLAQFFLTRKIFSGRPYVFLFVVFLCSYVVSGITMAMASLLILWPLMTETLKVFQYDAKDKLVWISTFGIFLGATLGQPMFPFKGAALIVTSAFTNVTGISVNYGAYVLYNLLMSLLIMICFLLFVKFVIRPDVSKMKAITAEQFREKKLPPMNVQQKIFLATCVGIIVLLLLPSVLPKGFFLRVFIQSFGINGLLILSIVVLMVLPLQGKPILDFRTVARKSISWDIVFLVAAAIYTCNAVSSDVTGIKEFLAGALQPLLGGKPEFIFVMILFAFALITSNFANNSGMAIVLMPIVVAFSDQYPDVPIIAVCMTITMVVFIAILTPAASPYAAMMHGMKDQISFKQIMILGIPVCVMALLLYTFIGYPVAKLLF